MFAVNQELKKSVKSPLQLRAAESELDQKSRETPKASKTSWRFWNAPLFRKKSSESKTRPRMGCLEKDGLDSGDPPSSLDDVGSNSFVVITVTTIDASDDPPMVAPSHSASTGGAQEIIFNNKVDQSQESSCSWLENCWS